MLNYSDKLTELTFLKINGHELPTHHIPYNDNMTKISSNDTVQILRFKSKCLYRTVEYGKVQYSTVRYQSQNWMLHCTGTYVR